MSIVKFLLPVMLLISTLSWAEVNVKPVYYAEKDKFSLAGYDFFADTQDPKFPIAEDDLILVVDEVEELLPGGGWRKSLTLVNPQSQEQKTFTTRVMNNSQEALVATAIETRRKVDNEFDVGDGFGTTYTWSLDLGYMLVLEDGIQLNLRMQRRVSTHWDFPMPDSYNFQILPGDRVKFLSEYRQGADFENVDYQIQLIRDNAIVETLGGNIEKNHVWGHARNDFNSHSEDGSILVVKEVSSSPPVYIDIFGKSFQAKDDLVRFYGIEGQWKIPYTQIYKSVGVSNSYKYKPYKGKQFEWVYTGKDNTVYVKPFDSDQPIPLTLFP